MRWRQPTPSGAGTKQQTSAATAALLAYLQFAASLAGAHSHTHWPRKRAAQNVSSTQARPGTRRRRVYRLNSFQYARPPAARVFHQGRVRRTAAVIHQVACNSSRPPFAESRSVLLTIDPDLLSCGTNLRTNGRRTRLHYSGDFVG